MKYIGHKSTEKKSTEDSNVDRYVFRYLKALLKPKADCNTAPTIQTILKPKR